jgi:quinol monooxygenase YgiN
LNTRDFLAILAIGALGVSAPSLTAAQTSMVPFIRWADLDVDPAQVESFKAAGDAHGRAVLRTEPGVIAFHAVSELDNPGRIRVLEMYQDAEAYRSHLKQPHFSNFRAATQRMMSGRQLYDVVPVRLGAKPRLTASPALFRDLRR